MKPGVFIYFRLRGRFRRYSVTRRSGARASQASLQPTGGSNWMDFAFEIEFSYGEMAM
jgi:hypothetical protein